MNLQVNWNESVCTGVILKSVTDIQKVISDAQSFRFNQWELSIPASGQSEAGILFVDVTDDRSLLRPWLHQLRWTRVGRVTCQDNFHQIFHDYNSNSWNALDKDWFSKLLKREKISKHKFPWAAAVNKLTANIKKDWIIYILLGKDYAAFFCHLVVRSILTNNSSINSNNNRWNSVMQEFIYVNNTPNCYWNTMLMLK